MHAKQTALDATDNDEVAAMDTLRGHSITYRIAA